MKKQIGGLVALTFCAAFVWTFMVPQILRSQPINPGVQYIGVPANNDCTKAVVVAGNFQGVTTTGGPCSPASAAANPTATAGPTAVNGVAATYMRSDAAPAVQLATGAQKGIAQVDGTTITAAAGVITTANTTFGGQSVAPGGSAGVQGNGAKVQLSTGAATSGDCVKFDANGNTVPNGAACPTQSNGANPSATAGPSAVNGVATTFMRSDGAPAIQKATNAIFGLVEGDATTITCVAGVCSTLINGILPTPTRAGDIIYWNGSNWVALAGNNSGTKILQETSSGVPSWVSAGAGTVTSVTSGNVALTVATTTTTPVITVSFPYFHAYPTSGSTTISSGLSTQMTGFTEVADSNNWFASNRFTPLLAGKYKMHIHVKCTGTVVTACVASLIKNGSNYFQAQYNNGTGTTGEDSDASILVDMNGSTDYVEANVVNVCTGTCAYGGGTGPEFTFFEADYISP